MIYVPTKQSDSRSTLLQAQQILANGAKNIHFLNYTNLKFNKFHHQDHKAIYFSRYFKETIFAISYLI